MAHRRMDICESAAPTPSHQSRRKREMKRQYEFIKDEASTVLKVWMTWVQPRA